MHCTKKMKTGTKQLPWFTVWREKQKDVAESMGISIQALTGVLYRARKWVKIHYNSDDYTK